MSTVKILICSVISVHLTWSIKLEKKTNIIKSIICNTLSDLTRISTFTNLK